MRFFIKNQQKHVFERRTAETCSLTFIFGQQRVLTSSTMPEKMNCIRLREPSHRSTEKSRAGAPPLASATPMCTETWPVYPGDQDRSKPENQHISRTRVSWTNWWLFWNVQLRLWVDCKWFRIDPECSRGLKLAKTCFSNKILTISKWNPFRIWDQIAKKHRKTWKNVWKILKI